MGQQPNPLSICSASGWLARFCAILAADFLEPCGPDSRGTSGPAVKHGLQMLAMVRMQSEEAQSFAAIYGEVVRRLEVCMVATACAGMI